MYDLNVSYPDGRTARAEVVSTRDPAERRLMARTEKIGYITVPQLTKYWQVEVLPGADIRHIKDAIVPILVEYERRATDPGPQGSSKGLSLDPPMNSVRVGVPEIEDAL
jgi:hypothetical protein